MTEPREDLTRRLNVLLAEMPAVSRLPAGHVVRVAWMRRKRALVADLERAGSGSGTAGRKYGTTS